MVPIRRSGRIGLSPCCVAAVAAVASWEANLLCCAFALHTVQAACSCSTPLSPMLPELPPSTLAKAPGPATDWAQRLYVWTERTHGRLAKPWACRELRIQCLYADIMRAVDSQSVRRFDERDILTSGSVRCPGSSHIISPVVTLGNDSLSWNQPSITEIETFRLTRIV